MHFHDNDFTRLCREASEIDCHDAAKLKAFIAKLAATDFREFSGYSFCSGYVLKHIPIRPSPALTALITQRRELEKHMYELDGKIRDEKKNKLTLTTLRGILKHARVVDKCGDGAR
jgi:hypothetical protein